MTRRIEKEKIKAIKVIVAGTESEPINLLNQVLIGLRTPAGFGLNTLSLKECFEEDGEYKTLFNGNIDYGAIGDITFRVEANKSLFFPPYTVASINFLKLSFLNSVGGNTVEILTREIK